MPYTSTATLEAQAPFDFARSLVFLGSFPAMHGEQSAGEQSLLKAFSIDGQVVAVRAQSRGGESLACTLYADQPISAEVERAALDRFAFFLSLKDDLRQFYAAGEADAVFAPVLRQLYGLHHVKFGTPFEAACWAILSQRTPMNVAQSVEHRLSEAVGLALTVDGETSLAFPEPAHLLSAAGDLAGIIGNPRKADYLLSAAQAFAQQDEGWLRDAPSDEVEAWLLRIKGIGVWSARFVLIRGLGHMDRLSVGEERMHDAVRRRYGSLSDAETEAVAARYGEYRAYWAYYLRASG